MNLGSSGRIPAGLTVLLVALLLLSACAGATGSSTDEGAAEASDESDDAAVEAEPEIADEPDAAEASDEDDDAAVEAEPEIADESDAEVAEPDPPAEPLPPLRGVYATLLIEGTTCSEIHDLEKGDLAEMVWAVVDPATTTILRELEILNPDGNDNESGCEFRYRTVGDVPRLDAYRVVSPLDDRETELSSMDLSPETGNRLLSLRVQASEELYRTIRVWGSRANRELVIEASGSGGEDNSANSGETCSDPSFDFTFETLVPFTCEDVYQTTIAILLGNGWDSPPPQSGIFLQAGVLCTQTVEQTYEPESTHIPILADALMERMCDADRSLLIPAR